jgi:putative transposase
MSIYIRHRFPSDIISYAVWLYYRFNLSHRDIEDLLAERGITVSREAIRIWCIEFGAIYARRLKRKHRGFRDTFFIDEVFVKINGRQLYLWRAVGQDGEVVDVYLQAKRDGTAAKRFFKRLLRSHGGEPRKIVSDKLRSYGVALISLTNYEFVMHSFFQRQYSRKPWRWQQSAPVTNMGRTEHPE